MAETVRGLILFAHGARDARWAEPLDRLRDRLTRIAPATPVAIAFLEIMEPNLSAAVDRLAGAGCDALCVVPIFLGQGGHVRRDLAALIDAVRARHPGLDITAVPAVGEDNGVLDALAVYCLAALDRPGEGARDPTTGG